MAGPSYSWAILGNGSSVESKGFSHPVNIWQRGSAVIHQIWKSVFIVAFGHPQVRQVMLHHSLFRRKSFVGYEGAHSTHGSSALHHYN